MFPFPPLLFSITTPELPIITLPWFQSLCMVEVARLVFAPVYVVPSPLLRRLFNRYSYIILEFLKVFDRVIEFPSAPLYPLVFCLRLKLRIPVIQFYPDVLSLPMLNSRDLVDQPMSIRHDFHSCSLISVFP